MSAQAATDAQAGPAKGACIMVQEGVNAAGGAGMHTLHCGERKREAHGQTRGQAGRKIGGGGNMGDKGIKEQGQVEVEVEEDRKPTGRGKRM